MPTVLADACIGNVLTMDETMPIPPLRAAAPPAFRSCECSAGRCRAEGGIEGGSAVQRSPMRPHRFDDIHSRGAYSSSGASKSVRWKPVPTAPRVPGCPHALAGGPPRPTPSSGALPHPPARRPAEPLSDDGGAVPDGRLATPVQGRKSRWGTGAQGMCPGDRLWKHEDGRRRDQSTRRSGGR